MDGTYIKERDGRVELKAEVQWRLVVTDHDWCLLEYGYKTLEHVLYL